MVTDCRVREDSADEKNKRIVLSFGSYFYEFKVVGGKSVNTDRWKQERNGRIVRIRIHLPSDVFVRMVKEAEKFADKLKANPNPEPAKTSPYEIANGPASDEERDEILYGKSAPTAPGLEPRPESNPPGYPCADFFPQTGPDKSRKQPYRCHVGRRGRPFIQVPIFA